VKHRIWGWIQVYKTCIGIIHQLSHPYEDTQVLRPMKRLENKPSIDQVWLSSLILTSLSGILVVLYATRWGAALSDDSYFYIHAARDLLSGNGFTLTPHFPPLLPLWLSTAGLFGFDPLEAIRWTNAFAFGINILLTGWLIRMISNSTVFSLVGALLFLASNTLIEAHAWAMSEPLYISLSLLGFGLFLKTHRKERFPTLLLAGVVFGLAAATRYIGVSLLLAATLVLISLLTTSEPNKRFQYGFGFGLAGAAPLLVWVIRNQLLTGRPTTRVLAWHPIEASQWLAGFNTILLWISPGRLVHGKEIYWLAAAGLLFFSWLFVTARRKRNHLGHHILSLLSSTGVLLLLLYVTSYLSLLVLARMLFDSRIPLDGRLLSPVLSTALILMMVLFAKLWSWRGVWVRAFLVMACLFLLVVNSTRSLEMVRSYHENGRGYASARDHISETYAYLRNKPDIPIYSNAMAAVYFWTGRDTQPIPSSAGLAEMKADMQQTGAFMVIFDSIPVELYQVTLAELTEGLVEQIRLSEATIYKYP
jgi:4-amino-4-deoxy-L-arabinose transferase-like glycosyltransferase